MKLFQSFWLQVLLVVALLSLKLLLSKNMGHNEVDVLPLARHFAEPQWISNDWYLDQPPGYRLLFATIFGHLAKSWGFLTTSIVGRLISYSLTGAGWVLLGRRLGLQLPFLLLAIVLFLLGFADSQGTIARESLVVDLEAKTLAYGLVLLGLGMLLSQFYVWMAILLGLATSFHVLVGGWAFLVAIGWLLWQREISKARHWLRLLILYAIGSIWAWGAVWQQLTTPNPVSALKPSFLYVFVRLPHHLNPLSWRAELWIEPIVYLILFAFCWGWLQRRKPLPFYPARIGLARYLLISLIPFGLGLLVAPFDTSGQLLQYYPFRLADILLPFTTALLLASVLQDSFVGRGRSILSLVCVLLLSVWFAGQWVEFRQQVLALRQFPVEKVADADWVALCGWVRQNTSPTATVVAPPEDEFASFSWMAERATIANYKLFPQTKAKILEWADRMADLSGNPDLWQTASRTATALRAQSTIAQGYRSMKVEQVRSILQKYRASYWIAHTEDRLKLPVAYRNGSYILYQFTDQSTLQPGPMS